MAKTPDEINDELAAEFRRVAEKASAALRGVTVGMAVGSSYNRHRAGSEADAAAALAALSQAERDALHRWARWLVGDVDG